MGSLFKTPKAPPALSAPSPVAVSTTAPSASVSADQTDTDIRNEAREQSLLRRNRGRFGTVNTGFTGFLGRIDSGDSRKTLLGE